MIMKLIKLIPVRLLTKYLPDILAYILTKVLTWVMVKYPQKTLKVKETVSEITQAMSASIKATEDGKITAKEVEDLKAKWKEVFR